jgi:hypothetical protein
LGSATIPTKTLGKTSALNAYMAMCTVKRKKAGARYESAFMSVRYTIWT